jgi:thiamine pyrophosphate-dependent acetolactate synthase large subunit-like protein
MTTNNKQLDWYRVADVDALGGAVPDDAIIAVDVGNNTYSFGRYFECQDQRILMSGYLGSIGFSFSAAMGAWAATQDQDEYRGRKVVSVSGDGGFGQYMGDFTTAVKYNMNITHVLLNNSELGKISKSSALANGRSGKRHCTTRVSPPMQICVAARAFGSLKPKNWSPHSMKRSPIRAHR